ncbi:RING-type E3 ubiquitin-protein ligase PPIL2 [Strongylocentrotus purpuratus]|uniref:RING-type E3 ubiquitin-protein ligase PPIL2 n=2 Tax=Strongylocentrotus purpuratus TaxID=7668 RepID=A0A7M7PT97_STRPU|nr:RING-type E3 ubiquitin-protein ligase PPIL2 [Strongylocentrotus purpuratus]
MGKRQHQSDKMYVTSKEWSAFYGGKKKTDPQKSEFRRLPFDHCSLSLQPFEHPYCTVDGIIFDLMSIVPFIKKYKANPITGQALDAKSLIKLNFHKNTDGKYHCPVTFKVFNENTHIVAVKTTGNVYCYEAIEQLNIKAKNWKDLLTDETFKRSDLITIQDPGQLDKFNISAFHHIKNNLKVEDEAEKKARKDPKYTLNKTNVETEDILGTLYKEYQPMDGKEEKKQRADKLNSAHYSTGMVAAGFTSTAMAPQTTHEAAVIDEDIIRYERVKKKGYVRMNTNKGTLNIELRCDLVTKTCENFIQLCAKGYYNGTKFHRLIKNFMIQGGDPTGTGTGGESIWEKPFEDDFKPNLSHTGRGILSMANSGPNTNKSQFFITFRSCKYLDEKHTIFGSVVGGLDTLTNMEKIETDKKDRPLEDIVIQDTVVFVNPYEEVDKEISEERLKLKVEEETKEKKAPQSRAVKPGTSDKPRVYRAGVGKYLAQTSMESTNARPSTSSASDLPSSNSGGVTKRPGEGERSYQADKKRVKSSTSLNDFSAW